MNIFGATRGTLRWVFACHGHMVIGTIPNRDAMPPPQLTADTPILDVLQPVVISLFKTLRHDLDAPITDHIQAGFRKGFNFDEPLLGDHRLDDFTTALRTWNGRAIGLGFDDESGGFHIRPDVFTRIESVLTLIL